MHVRDFWRRLKSRPATQFVGDTVSACLEDDVARISAALAYYTLFSLAPLLLISVAVTGLVFGEKAAQRGIVSQIGGLIGQHGAQAVQTIMASAHKPTKGVIAGCSAQAS